MVLLTVIRLANIFSGPRTITYGCSIDHSIPLCIVCCEEVGHREMGDAPDRNREFKSYRLTKKGRKQLAVEESLWKEMAEAVARVMSPATEES